MESFIFLSLLVIKLLTWGIFDPGGHCDIMLGVRILLICKTHYHKWISRTKISLNEKFHVFISHSYQLIDQGHFLTPGGQHDVIVGVKI
jgi:hypothetical protein